MQTRFGVMVAMSTLALALTSAQQGTTDRVAGWRRDIEHLVAEARRLHAGPERPAHSAAFARAAAELSRRVPDLPDRRVVVELQRLLAMLGDGHSLVYPMPGPRTSFQMLPVELYQFEDGLFIVDGSGPAQELIGSRVVRFGPLRTEEVLRRMAPYVSRDNEIGLKAFVGLYAVMPAFLEAWGATSDTSRVGLTVVDRAQRERTVTLDAGPARRTRRRLFPPPGTEAAAPLAFQQVDRPYHLRVLPEHDALWFQFNQVTNAPDEPLAAFASRLGDTLNARNVRHLIVDVRHNTGGNNLLLAPLVETIASFASASPARRVYVLTSRSTFSAAQNFINRLERRVPTAIFAGEPSMSSPNFTGEDHAVTLPFSGLVVSISNRHWQDSHPRDRRPWIAPQIPVAITSRDWLGNRDPVLDAVLRHAAGRERRH